MKITKQMALAYQVDLIYKTIINSPQAKVKSESGKPMYTFVTRDASSNEVGMMQDYKESFEKSSTREEKIKILKDCAKHVGTDGGFYRTSEHTNNNLVPGENVLFMFGASDKETIARNILCIQDVHNNAERLTGSGDYTYSTMIFAIPTTVAKNHRFKGTYGKVWGDYLLTEYHLPAEEYDPTSLLAGGVVPDILTWIDNVYKTNDIDELIELQRGSFVDKNDPLNFENIKKYFETSHTFPATHAMVCDLFEEYFADVSQTPEDESYDSEDDSEEDYDESKDFSVFRTEEEFQDGELREIVSGIIDNPSYSNADKKQLLAYYSEMLGAGDRIAELAQKGGFSYTPTKVAKAPQKDDTLAPQGPAQ